MRGRLISSVFLLVGLPFGALADSNFYCLCVDGTPDGSESFSHCVSPQTHAICNSLAETLDMVGINDVGIMYSFTWGAGAILIFWAIGYAVRTALRSLNHI